MVREYVNEHPLVSGGMALLGTMLIFFLIWRGATQSNDVTRALTQAWYTDDDGKTWYSGDKSRNPPFDHNGKTAVRAFVFKCDADNREFVGYLERYTPQA